MEFKGLIINNVDRINITEKYSITNDEAARARVGLRLLDRADLLDRVPIYVGGEVSETWSTRESAEAVVVGNLALLHNITVNPSDPSQSRLLAAQATVESGLSALEEGAKDAAGHFHKVFEKN